MVKGAGLLKHARLTRRQLVAFALASAALNGVVTASVGAWLAQTYSQHQSRRHSIETISNLLYARRTRAGMVASSIRRDAAIEEVRERKRAYDDAYVAWNTEVRRNLFVIRDVMGDGKGGQASIEQDFEDSLVATLADVDRCITTAYDARVANADGVAILSACDMSRLHQFVLDCGSTFINELDKLTRLSFLPFAAESAESKAKAEARIRRGCQRSADAAPGEAAPPSGDGTAPAVSPEGATGMPPATDGPPTKPAQ